MTDIAKLAIEIDSTGAKTGADQAVSSAERVKTSFTGMGRALDQSSTGFRRLSPEAQALAKEYELLRQRVQNGTLAVEDFVKLQNALLAQMAKLPAAEQQTTRARQRSEQETVKYSRAIQHEVNQLKGLTVEAQRAAAQEERLVALRQRLQQAAQAGQQVAQTTVATGAAASTAAGGFQKLERPLQAVAIGATGLPGPVGRAAAALGMLAIGGPVTVGVLAGLAIIASTIDRLRRPLKDLEDRLDSIREKNRDPAIQLRLDRETLERQLAEVERRIERTRAAIARSPSLENAAGVSEGLERDLRRQAELYQQIGLIRREQAGEDRKGDDEKRQRISELRDLEIRAASATLEASGQTARAKLALIDGQLQLRLEEIAANEKLTQAEKDRAAAAERQLATAQRQGVLEAQAAERRSQAVKLAQTEAEVQAAGLTARGRAAQAEQLLLDARLQQQLQEVALMDHLSAMEKARLRIALETLAAYQGQSIAMKAAADVLAKVNADFARQQEAVARQQARTRSSPEGQIQAQDKAIADFTRGLGADVDRLLRELRDKEIDRLEAIVRAHQEARDAAIGYLEVLGAISPELATLAFALSDLAGVIEAFKKGLATPKDVAAAVGAVGAAIPRTSAVGSAASGALSLGSAGFQIGGPIGAGIGALTGIATGLIGFGKSAREAEKQLQDTVRDWKRSLGDFLTNITGSLSSFEQEAQDARRFVEQKFKEILGVAKSKGLEFDFGKDVEVASEEEFLRFLETAARHGGRFRDEIQKLIETYQKAQAAIEEQRAAAQKAFQDDLEVRRLEAEGRSDEAAIRRQQIAAERELQDALREKYDDATIAALKYVQGLEAEALAKEQAARAAKDAEEKALREQTFAEDLEVRRLAATGDIAGAEAYRRELEKEREVREAVTAGMSAYSIEILKQVQALEDVTAAQRKAREELAVSQDLDVRFLRSIGQNEAADELERDVARQREIDRAVEAGYTPEQIDFLREIQRNEERQRLAALTGAGQQPTTGPNSVRDITGLSEQTGLRIDNRLFTMATLLRDIRDILRNGQGRLAGRQVLVLQQPIPGAVDSESIARDIDRLGATTLDTTNSAAGVRPSI